MRALGWKQCRRGSNILRIIANPVKSGPERYSGNGVLDLAHIQARTDNPIGESLYGCGSRSDLAAEFNICFQFQVHMADCTDGSRSGRDLKKTGPLLNMSAPGHVRVTDWACVCVGEGEGECVCVCKKERCQRQRRVCLCVTECSQNGSSSA